MSYLIHLTKKSRRNSKLTYCTARPGFIFQNNNFYLLSFEKKLDENFLLNYI